MDIKRLLRQELERITPTREELTMLGSLAVLFKEALDKELGKAKLDADLFIGGSFVKGTLVKNEGYDVDIYTRFSWKYSDLDKLLKSPLERTCKALKFNFETVHGSRDYFRVHANVPGKKVILEIIPVTRINKPHEERNVTDLSYFHVNYVKKAAKGLEGEIRLAKAFCRAQGVYGAESYINGFSGYGLECLIIHYKSFLNMLKQLSKIDDERLVIDMKKTYKNKQELLISMNEAKTRGPIVFVDPTHKDRNVLAALNHESIVKFKDAALRFLKSPRENFFRKKEINYEQFAKIARQKKAEHIVVNLKTDRQEGDIAGTKMKKFSNYLRMELNKIADIIEFEFGYGNGKESKVYIVAKPRSEIIRVGPPVDMAKYVKEFKKNHKDTFVKNNIIHARIKLRHGLKEIISKITSDNNKLESMGIVDITIKN